MPSRRASWAGNTARCTWSRRLFSVPFALLLGFSSSAGDVTDLQFGVLLAVALVLLVVLAAAHLEDAHLVVLAVRHDRGFHRGTGYQGHPDLQVAAVADCENLVDGDFLADVRSNLFYFDLVAGSNTILLASGFYD